MAENFYSDGVRQGLSRHWDKDGSLLTEYQYLNGKKHGICREYWPGGNFSQVATYRHGELHGVYREFYSSGEPQSLLQYDNGKVKSVQSWTPDGQAFSCTLKENSDVEPLHAIMYGASPLDGVAEEVDHCWGVQLLHGFQIVPTLQRCIYTQYVSGVRDGFQLFYLYGGPLLVAGVNRDGKRWSGVCPSQEGFAGFLSQYSEGKKDGVELCYYADLLEDKSGRTFSMRRLPISGVYRKGEKWEGDFLCFDAKNRLWAFEQWKSGGLVSRELIGKGYCSRDIVAKAVEVIGRSLER